MLEHYVNDEDFSKWVEKCVAYASAHPERYRRKVLAMARFGYWLVPVMMAVLIALPAAIVYAIVIGEGSIVQKVLVGALGAFYGYGLFQTARAFFAPYEPLEGFDVTADEVPALFQMIDEARSSLNAPALDRVALVNELNAAAVQMPKRSFLGKPTNELIIGLPLMEALQRDELKSVIAHEFGHFSGEHGHDSYVVFRTMRAWEIALASAEAYGGVAGIVPHLMAKWFVPRFMAYTFAQRLDNEFFADRAAVTATNAATVASALTRVELAEYRMSENYTRFMREAVPAAEPPEEVLRQLYAGLGDIQEDPLAGGRMLMALHTERDPMDTHPSLSERLASIGIEPELPPAVDRPAIEALGDVVDRVYAHFNAEQLEAMRESWASWHKTFHEEKEELAKLHSQASDGKLPLKDAMRRLILSGMESDDEERQGFFRQTLDWYPEEPRALYAMGSFLARQHDMAALDYLEEAAQRDETASGAVLSMATELAAVRDDASMVAECREKAQSWFEENGERLQKLEEPTPGGTLEVCDIDDGAREQLAAGLDANSISLSKAYLVTKPMSEWFESRDWLVIEPRLYGHFLSADELAGEVYGAVYEAGLVPYFRIWVLEKGEDWLRQQLDQMPETLVWVNGKDVAEAA